MHRLEIVKHVSLDKKPDILSLTKFCVLEIFYLFNIHHIVLPMTLFSISVFRLVSAEFPEELSLMELLKTKKNSLQI